MTKLYHYRYIFGCQFFGGWQLNVYMHDGKLNMAYSCFHIIPVKAGFAFCIIFYAVFSLGILGQAGRLA